MLGIAARHADIWNSMSFAKAFDAQLEETRPRVATIDAQCASIGRDPASPRRSYLMFDPPARGSGGVISYCESEEKFSEMAGKVPAPGMSEFALYYPMLRQRAGGHPQGDRCRSVLMLPMLPTKRRLTTWTSPVSAAR